MATPKQQDEAVIRDMQQSLDANNLLHCLRLIHANPKLAGKLRAMWQKKADEEWERELAEDLDNEQQLLQESHQEDLAA